MNGFQITYAVFMVIAGLFQYRSYTWAVLACSFVVTLSICYQMDIGYLSDTEAMAWFIVIDLFTGMLLALHDKIAKVIACGFTVTIPVYLLGSHLDFTNATTFAIVYPIAAAQLLVCIVGSNGNGGRSITVVDSFNERFGGVNSIKAALGV